jgi:hypothetical protein
VPTKRPRSKTTATISAATLILLGVGAACGVRLRDPATPYAPSERVVASTAVATARVPAGTRISVELEEDVDLAAPTRQGNRFAARLRGTLATDGRVVAENASRIEGRIVARDLDHEQITVRFDTVETRAGAWPIDAVVVDAGRFAVVEDLEGGVLRRSAARETRAIGGGPPTVPLSRVILPAGGILELVLVKPFVGAVH